MKFKIRLVAPVRITATVEFEMEAKNEDEAYELAFIEYKDRIAAFKKEQNEYLRNNRPYPEYPFCWDVDSDDIEANMHERDIEVESVTEVKDEGKLSVGD